MGTNFYIRQRVSQQQKEEIINSINKENWYNLKQLIPKEIHIGKRSCGWKFLWNANHFQYFNPNKESLIQFLKSGQIYDEYGEQFTFDQFWNDEIAHHINDDFNKWDLETYYKENHENYIRCEEDYIIRDFKDRWNINVNPYGEFYIDDLRFTTCDYFS